MKLNIDVISINNLPKDIELYKNKKFEDFIDYSDEYEKVYITDTKYINFYGNMENEIRIRLKKEKYKNKFENVEVKSEHILIYKVDDVIICYDTNFKCYVFTNNQIINNIKNNLKYIKSIKVGKLVLKSNTLIFIKQNTNIKSAKIIN